MQHKWFSTHGLERHDSFLPDTDVTMPEVFTATGYETVAFSANPAFVTPEAGLAQGFDRFDVRHGKEVELESGMDLAGVAAAPHLRTQSLRALTADERRSSRGERHRLQRSDSIA